MRGIDDFGGLRKPAPVFAGLMGIALFSSLGLPGLNGFVGEFLIFRGVFPLSWVAATFRCSVAGYRGVILTVIQKVFTGPVPERWAEFPDLHDGERHGDGAGDWIDVPARLVPQLDCGQREPDGGEPAGALEILTMLAWTIYLSFAGALVLALLPKGNAALGAVVCACRWRWRDLRLRLPGFAAGAGQGRVTHRGCAVGSIAGHSLSCWRRTASASCWCC